MQFSPVAQVAGQVASTQVPLLHESPAAQLAEQAAATHVLPLGQPPAAQEVIPQVPAVHWLLLHTPGAQVFLSTGHVAVVHPFPLQVLAGLHR